MKLDEGLNKYQSLQRADYFEVNQSLSENLWKKEQIPTVTDIAEFMNTGHNDKIENIFNFFDNRDDFLKMATRVDNNYDQDESSAFIRKVMSANNEEISKAGYFYKLLMASADDLVIKENTCDSKGVEYNVNLLTKDLFDYRIKFMWVNEYKDFVKITYEKFIEWLKENKYEIIHVRTPLTCSHVKDHHICKKCAGNLPHGTNNIGTFTALMVTEHATQSALSSMNKGRKDNINDLLTIGYQGPQNWEEIFKWIEDIVQKLENKNVSARFYEIALISRIRMDGELPFVSSLKGSINHSGNLFGSYIFTPTNKNFEKIIRKGSFEDNSLKLQIAMNDLRKR